MCLHASHSRDDQRVGEEQRSQQAAAAVRVLPLPLVHLAAAVVAAAAQAEEEADQRHQHGEHQADRGTHREADLVVDDLRAARAKGGGPGTIYLGNNIRENKSMKEKTGWRYTRRIT